LALFVWAWWPTLLELERTWNREPDYSHGYLVVPLALVFLWLRRDRFPSGKISPSWLGLLLIAASVGVHSLGGLWRLGGVDGWSILIWVAGAVCLLGGLRLLFWCLPSIAFLFFMVPLPYRLEHLMSHPLQQVAAKTSGWLLRCLAHPALVDGNTILLGDERLEVAAACSGLRIFVGILALAAAYVIAVRRPWWEKALLLASVVPVALTANTMRIVATGLLYVHTSASTAKSFSHDLAGWTMIPVAAALFAMVLWYIGCLFKEVEVMDMRRLVRRRSA
jgi:exosortase